MQQGRPDKVRPNAIHTSSLALRYSKCPFLNFLTFSRLCKHYQHKIATVAKGKTRWTDTPCCSQEISAKYQLPSPCHPLELMALSTHFTFGGVMCYLWLLWMAFQNVQCPHTLYASFGGLSVQCQTVTHIPTLNVIGVDWKLNLAGAQLWRASVHGTFEEIRAPGAPKCSLLRYLRFIFGVL